MGTKKRVMRSGKKIAHPVSNKPRFNFIEETFVSARGVKTKIWTLPAAEMESVMNDSDSDSASDSDGEPYPNFGVGVNPHESVLSNCDRAQQKISVGRNLGFTRRCKLNLLRKRGQRLEHKLIKKPAPSVPRFNFIQDTFVSARGVKTKVWTLPPAEMDSVMNDSDSDSDSDSDGSHDLHLYPNLASNALFSSGISGEAGAAPSKEQTYSLASCIEEITKHVELLKQGLLFSWITKTGALPHYTQSAGIVCCTLLNNFVCFCKLFTKFVCCFAGECWAAALSTGHAYYMAANKIDGERVTIELLLDGVSKEHLMGSGGIDRLESARDFMVTNGYVTDMIVHRRPSVSEEFAGYEILLEKLLARGPMVVVFDILPRYKDYDGKSIFIPDETECRVSVLERCKQHSVVVTGCGVGLVEGKPTEFWQTHDSQKPPWGVDGFGQLARRNGLIVAAVEFKV
ncbi:unnamed protein product [Brassica oleracea]